MPSKTPAPRHLTNPPARREIRPDFPRTINVRDAEEIFAVFGRELEKYGTSLDQVGHITLAYPHKHPDLFPEHNNAATRPLDVFKDTVHRYAPNVDWVTADGLVETIHLGRSENQTSLHALMAHQVYDIHKLSQTTPLPFLEKKGDEKEFFVIVDWTVYQGTTVANLMSYIEHNGGTVLAVAADEFASDIAQQTTSENPSQKLSRRFNDMSRNTARMEELATMLSDVAGQESFNLTPEQCLTLLEKGLKKNGNSVYAMTNGECEKLINGIINSNENKIYCGGASFSFSSFFKELGVDLPSANKPRRSKAPSPTA